ncbi:MAG: hypothetical protein P4L83_05085 [Nevskia sp.]|nr:hypothetical protein [Nevskia sp.]
MSQGMSDSDCGLRRRRQDVRKAALYGIDYVEVGPAQTTLEVFFLGKAPPGVETANVVISGGSPVQVGNIRLYRQRDPTLDDWMEVYLAAPGDFSVYTLALVKLDESGHPTTQALDGLDPLYATARFSFKASCPSGLDCRPQHVCPPPARVEPDINYLAKDYTSFVQLIRDRLAQTMPQWQETHEPDIGVMLVELLAYVGDQLSYYQDAVATEAYLGTARQRISLRRHARLVDYDMHEGCSARAWVTVSTDADLDLDPAQVFFCTAFPGVPATTVLEPADYAKAAPGSCVVFEPLVADPSQPLALRAAHDEIRFYTWGDCACCLPKGATQATLLDAWVKTDASNAGGVKARALSLKAGDVLLFEEVIGPRTGNPADADPTHRQAVRLTKVTPTVDPLYDRDSGGRPVVQIEWCSEDALTFPLCLSAVMPAPDCSCREGISVARGNVVLVEQGTKVVEALGTVGTQSSASTCPSDCHPPSVRLTPAPFRPVLQQAPLSYGQPLPVCGCASSVIVQDPRQALPRIQLTGTATTPQGPVSSTWTAQADLLESGPDDADFVVEIDDAGAAHLRFGNGDEGLQPAAGTTFQACYRVGNGPDGNVGAETIRYLVWRQTGGSGAKLKPRNPLAASGGTAPEAADDVRMFAPYAFRDVLNRAITADDYATLAADNARRLAERPRLLTLPAPPPPKLVGDHRAEEEEEPGATTPMPADICSVPFHKLQGAQGTLSWNGSWYEVQVAVDPLGSETADSELLQEIDAYLEPYRRIGHDLDVQAADYVSLDLGLSVCVMPGILRGQVEAALRAVLGTGVLPDGTLAMFNPDRLSFGQGIYASRIVAATQAIGGVMEVTLTRLARYQVGSAPPGRKPDQVPKNGVLALGPFEIPRLDNNPNAPGNGRLTLLLRGGR